MNNVGFLFKENLIEPARISFHALSVKTYRAKPHPVEEEGFLLPN